MSPKALVTAAALALASLFGCATVAEAESRDLPSQLGKGPKAAKAGEQTLVVGAGCFWCIEAQFEMLKGVKSVVSGYAGGDVENPTYMMVMSGRTGHAEVVKVTFDPSVIAAEDLLRIFFVSHDPTQLNRQGNDVGTQYRSAIFYRDEAERKLAERIKAEITKEKLFDDPVVTTLEPLSKFWKAEEYHQDYFAKFQKASEAERAKMNVGYCTYVVNPKVEKFREKFSHLIKKD